VLVRRCVSSCYLAVLSALVAGGVGRWWFVVWVCVVLWVLCAVYVWVCGLVLVDGLV
jgi:hypothetical protein